MFITVDSFFSVSLLCCKLFRRLKDALHSVIKERDCLIDKLKYHIKEAEDLQKLAKLLTEENTSLALDKVCLNQRTANTSSPWTEAIHLHKDILNHFQL